MAQLSISSQQCLPELLKMMGQIGIAVAQIHLWPGQKADSWFHTCFLIQLRTPGCQASSRFKLQDGKSADSQLTSVDLMGS